ncbi:MAG: hypothetical protein NT093_00275 [Candidatus Moranbacteria bacterium]|nr:hypothetical protein [Candidatus Moranbacteria bacterium]
MTQQSDILSRLVPLRPLDIEKCPTVAETVGQMEYCSIGAQTIGEVARSLVELAQMAKKPILVYDGAYGTPLGKLLRRMAREKKWFSDILRPDQYASKKIPSGGVVLAVDLFSRRHENLLFNKPDRALFINTSSQFKPVIRKTLSIAIRNMRCRSCMPRLRSGSKENSGRTKDSCASWPSSAVSLPRFREASKFC